MHSPPARAPQGTQPARVPPSAMRAAGSFDSEDAIAPAQVDAARKTDEYSCCWWARDGDVSPDLPQSLSRKKA